MGWNNPRHCVPTVEQFPAWCQSVGTSRKPRPTIGMGGMDFLSGMERTERGRWGATEASYSFHALVFDGFGGMGLAAGVGRAPCGGGRPRTDGARVYPEDHPQRRGDIRRDRFLQTPTPSTTLMRMILQCAGGRWEMGTAAGSRCHFGSGSCGRGRPRSVRGEALGRTERGCIWRITRRGVGTSDGIAFIGRVGLRPRCCD